MLILESCVSSEEMSKIVKPTDIKELDYFTPLTNMGFIEKGNQIEYDPELSEHSLELIESLINSSKRKYSIKDSLSPNDSLIQIKINEEIIALAVKAYNKQRVHLINLTPTIDSVMEANDQRFSLALIAVGFSRQKGNYGGQLAKGAVIGILTLGTYVSTPIKAKSTIHGLIFDSKNNTIALYKRTSNEKEPLNINNLENQMEFILYNLLKENKLKKQS
jgi:hypothetical protein